MIVEVLSRSNLWLSWLEAVWMGKRFPTSIFMQIPHMHLEIVLVWQHLFGSTRTGTCLLQSNTNNQIHMLPTKSPEPTNEDNNFFELLIIYYLQHKISILRSVRTMYAVLASFCSCRICNRAYTVRAPPAHGLCLCGGSCRTLWRTAYHSRGRRASRHLRR